MSAVYKRLGGREISSTSTSQATTATATATTTTQGLNPSLILSTSTSIPIPTSSTTIISGTIPLSTTISTPIQMQIPILSTPISTTIPTIISSSQIDHAMQKLNAELICPICQNLFVLTSTLTCGHSYCSECINEWLRSCQACPVCRNQVFHPPVRSRIVDNAVEITLDHNINEQIKQEWIKRKQESIENEKKQIIERNTLTSLLTKAIDKGYKVVSISIPWSDEEQTRFINNIKQYQGEARIGYCSIVGLTPEFSLSSNVKDLIIAAKNIRLTDKSVSISKPWNDKCVAKLRSRINMYIYYG